MAVQASITINDNASVARTYSPRGANIGYAIWIDIASALTPRGEAKIEAFFNRPKNGDKNYHVRVKHSFPQEVTDATTGVTTVQNVAFYEGKYTIPQDMTDVNRGDFAVLTANAGLNLEILRIARDLNPAF